MGRSGDKKCVYFSCFFFFLLKGLLLLLLFILLPCRILFFFFFSRCSVAESCLILWGHGVEPARLLCPENSPFNYTGVGCYSLLQGIFATQRWNQHLLLWQLDSLPPVHPGSPFFLYELISLSTFLLWLLDLNVKILLTLRSQIIFYTFFYYLQFQFYI